MPGFKLLSVGLTDEEFDEFVSLCREKGINSNEALADAVRLWVYMEKPHTRLVVKIGDEGQMLPVIEEKPEGV